MKKVLFLCLAIVSFQISNAQDAKKAAGLYNEGLAKAKAKEYVDALSLMEQAIEAATAENDEKVMKLAKANGTRAAYGAGNTHMKAGDLDAAMAAFDKGIEFNPDYYTNHVGKAQVLEKKSMVSEAIGTYLLASEAAIKADKADRAQNYSGKAKNIIALAASKDEWANAQKYAEAYLAVKENGDVLYYLGEAQYNQKNMDGAMASLGKAITAGGEKVHNAHYVKGQIHEKLGQKDQAIAEYGKVTGGKYIKMAKYNADQLSKG